MRTVNLTEKNIRPEPCLPVVVPANTSMKVLKDLTDQEFAGVEFSGRYLFNAGSDNMYYAFGGNADNVNNYNGWMVPGQQLDCSNHGAAVYVWSAAGGKCVPTVLRRIDYSNSVQVLADKHP